MTNDRFRELNRKDPKPPLTEEEYAEGWHYCYDWDGLLVNSNDTEGEGACCTCKEKPQDAAEPVAYMDADGNFSDNNDYGTFNIPLYTTPPATQAGPVIPAGFALVPIRATTAMAEVFAEEGWEWANVLAAAEAVTEGEYEEALEGTPPATQAALTAALGFLNRVTHWQEGKPDMHDIKVMLKEALK